MGNESIEEKTEAMCTNYHTQSVPTCIVVGAGGRGKDAYSPYIYNSGVMRIVGVAELDDKKRNEFKAQYNIEESMCFKTFEDLFQRGKLADAVLICTQDRQHYLPAKLAMDCGYHILLEKPISPFEREIEELQQRVLRYDKVFITAFVLRYTPFIEKIKEMLDAGLVGNIVTMQLNENEGFWHHAHSYVRGQWNNSETSSPVIVSKSCHDTDLILYLMGSKCISVASYGDNSHFKPENAPGKVPLRCTDGCEFADSCKYNAVKLYTEGKCSYFVHKFECGYEKEAVIEALKTNPYGRCVYRCDNNVCDHQVMALSFENGATAVFTLSAFSPDNNRTLKIMGTEGEIGGCLEKGEIVLKRFSDMTEERYVVSHDETKHSGGDSGIINHFVSLINGDFHHNDEKMFSSHKIAFAAEKSRIMKKEVFL